MQFGTDSGPDTASRLGDLVLGHRLRALSLLALSVAGWLFVAWLGLDMESPLAQLAMPMSADWSGANVAAVWTMWSVMMVAMMLPSALPMMLAFVVVARRSGEPVRARAFLLAYLAVWLVFGAAATALQWRLQSSGVVSPMLATTSPLFAALLLVMAGAYQFSPLKRVCLVSCRTPFAFLLGEWRPGVRGAFIMGLRHGVLCLGCCWALMVLLFIGGVMNLGWVAALALAVAIEKLAPGGERVAWVLGAALLLAGTVRLAMLVV